RFLDEEVRRPREALAYDGEVGVRRGADEDGLGLRGTIQRIDARIERRPQALAGEMLREAGVAVDEADQLGLRVNLEQVAVDHAHAAGADDRGPERAPLTHAASSNVRRSPSTSGVRRGR